MSDLPREIVPALLAWFAQNARILPWRVQRDPYRVWVSEIMLQQTRVDTVIAYFERFMRALPTVEKLAAAPESELMALWAGLGYYRRMRFLHACARTVVEKYDGKFPSNREDLCKLPGIGAYTAGAIASIAFGLPAPAVDGNVLRVLSRLTASNAWDQKQAGAALQPLYPSGQCGAFTESLMELGATVCLPNGAPRCTGCPLAAWCGVRRTGAWEAYPRRSEKTVRPVENISVFILWHDGLVAVRKRPENGLLAGLWEFPNVSGDGSAVAETYGKILKIRHARHIFTHREWNMTVFEIAADQNPAFEWVSPDACPLPGAFRKLL